MGETNQIYRILFNLNIKIITTIMGKKSRNIKNNSLIQANVNPNDPG